MTVFRVSEQPVPIALHLPVHGDYVVAAALDGYMADPGTDPVDAEGAKELRRRVLDPDVPLIPLGPNEADLLAYAFNHAIAARGDAQATAP